MTIRHPVKADSKSFRRVKNVIFNLAACWLSFFERQWRWWSAGEDVFRAAARNVGGGNSAGKHNIFQDVLPTMQVDNDTNDCYSMIQSLEHVLQNINKLNRSLEEVIAV